MQSPDGGGLKELCVHIHWLRHGHLDASLPPVPLTHQVNTSEMCLLVEHRTGTLMNSRRRWGEKVKNPQVLIKLSWDKKERGLWS